MTKVLAFDLGASSGRTVIGNFKNGKLGLNIIKRFDNKPIKKEDNLYWNFDQLYQCIKDGILYAQEDNKIQTLGIDTWGVDFGLIDEFGNLIQNPKHYRNVQTDEVFNRISDFISLQELYECTGNQVMKINTLFQLLALREQEPKTFFKARKLLMISDLFNYKLTGKMRTENSIASTTQLTNPYSKKWSKKIIESFNLNSQLFPEIVDEGNILGIINPSLELGNVQVINVSQHDTASAIISIPFTEPSIFISCGTWSLVGTELEHPILNKKAREYNLTNESGYGKTTDLLKNCTGLWIVQELKRNYETDQLDLTYDQITDLAKKEKKHCFIDTDDDIFSSPGDMREKITYYAKRTHQQAPNTIGGFFKCAYESLAKKYQKTIDEIESTTNLKFKKIHIVGGGSKSEYFCQMIADVTNKKVLAGPAEATAMGNILIQLISLGEISNVKEARSIVSNSIELKEYVPKD